MLLYVNGQRFEIRGEAAFASLTDFLRKELQLTGTKVVCAEGDCGACTVLVSRLDGDTLRYEPVDACIQFLYQLDGKYVVTVEGLQTAQGDSASGAAGDGRVSRLAMRLLHARLRHGPRRPVRATCPRGKRVAANGPDRQPVPLHWLPADPDRWPVRRSKNSGRVRRALLAEKCGRRSAQTCRGWHLDSSALLRGRDKRRTFFAPRNLEEASAFKARNPEAIIVSGGTELGVLRNKRGLDPPTLLSLANVPGLATIANTEDGVSIGANVTWTQVEQFAKETLPEFYKIIIRFGSPQIRNVSTLVANVAHGSPIADSLPFLCVMDAELELAGRAGRRQVSINKFYKGYKVKDLAADEIITRVLFPLPAADELLKLYKVSKRNDLDIASFGAAIRVRHAGEIITRAQVAYSGVAPTVTRLPATEAFLQGKLLTEATFREAGRVARSEIQPISDVRGSRDFRLVLAENILRKFYFECLGAETLAVE